jgi:hypothetical protein
VTAADGTFGDDAPLAAVVVGHGCLLDDEPTSRNLNLERGVVEVAARPAAQPRRDELVDAPVETYRVTARTER